MPSCEVAGAIFPQGQRVSLEINIQEFGTSLGLAENVQPFPVGRPIKSQDALPTFHANSLRRLAAKRKNVDRPFGVPCRGNPRAVSRKGQSPAIVVRVEIKPRDFSTSPLCRIKVRKDDFACDFGSVRRSNTGSRVTTRKEFGYVVWP